MDLLNRFQNYLERRRRERETIFELSSLSDRELADLGIGRSDIRRIAQAGALRGTIDLYAWRDGRAAEVGGPSGLKAA
jgi:uncharacterized protein YjiS (DUF1127 family)